MKQQISLSTLSSSFNFQKLKRLRIGVLSSVKFNQPEIDLEYFYVQFIFLALQSRNLLLRNQLNI
jgi:hypothetical protein